MRVGGSWKKRLPRPYSIILQMTIWSFLVSIVTYASPEYSPQAISPPSRFSSSARIVETEKGFCVIQDEGMAMEERKKETSLAYVNFLIGKTLYKNQDVAELKEQLRLYGPWQICVERVAKTEGLYVTYQKYPLGPPRILHYFLHEKNSHTGKYVSLTQENSNALLVEPLDEMQYQKIKNDVKVLFSPEDGCEEELVSAIDDAERTIDAAIGGFTNIKISDALKKASRRGVVIRIFLGVKSSSSKLAEELECYDAGIKYCHKKIASLQNKFMIVDEKKVYTGSYDWTYLEEKENRESIMAIPYAKSFGDEFNYLWNDKDRPPPEDHEGKIIKLIQKEGIEKKFRPGIPRNIKIALYYFTNKDIAKALFDAKENGVDVEIILDRTQKKSSYSIEKYFKHLQKKGRLAKSGHLYIRYYRVMNGMKQNKFAIIGGATVSGSYNWTKNTECKNKEGFIVIPSIIKDYLEEFDRLSKDVCEEIVIGETEYNTNQARAPPPGTGLESDDSSNCPAEIVRLVNDTAELLKRNANRSSASGTDPPQKSEEDLSGINDYSKRFDPRDLARLRPIDRKTIKGNPDEDVRVRHNTTLEALEIIMAGGIVKTSRDGNVYVESVDMPVINGVVLQRIDAKATELGISWNKACGGLDFYIKRRDLGITKNPATGNNDLVICNDVLLTNRQPQKFIRPDPENIAYSSSGQVIKDDISLYKTSGLDPPIQNRTLYNDFRLNASGGSPPGPPPPGPPPRPLAAEAVHVPHGHSSHGAHHEDDDDDDEEDKSGNST